MQNKAAINLVSAKTRAEPISGCHWWSDGWRICEQKMGVHRLWSGSAWSKAEDSNHTDWTYQTYLQAWCQRAIYILCMAN